MKNLKTFSTLILINLGFFCNAQDYLYKKDGEIIKSKVIEIGVDEIKYRPYGQVDGPIYAEEKELIQRIEFENGDVLNLDKKNKGGDSKMENSAYYTGQRKNNIKVSFTSLLFNHLDFVYERSLTPSQSIEGGINIIGLGVVEDNYRPRNAAGLGLHVGFKFKRSPDFYIPKMRYGHILKGSYIKPQLILTVYGEDVSYYDHLSQNGYKVDRETAVSGAFMLNFGKQQIFSDRFSLDYYVGIGYGFTNSKNANTDDFTNQKVESYSPVQHGFLITEGIPLAFTAGLSIGYVFDWKKK